jgi:hypothetical protein
MTGSLSQWHRRPRALHSPRTRLDNVALVPASELASLKQWQERARQLPPGATLLVIPSNNRHLRSIGIRIAQSLNRLGRSTHLVSTRQG